MMTTKTLLNSQVWTKPNLDYPTGVNFGRVVKQTAKSIWIQDQFSLTKWNQINDSKYRCVSLNLTKTFNFQTDPFMDFVFGKNRA
jgi:hypothetical protein